MFYFWIVIGLIALALGIFLIIKNEQRIKKQKLVSRTTIQQSTGMKKCGYCGTVVENLIAICPACQKAICKNCGNPIGSGVTKCPKCGEATTIGSIQNLGWLSLIVGIIIIVIIVLLVTC